MGPLEHKAEKWGDAAGKVGEEITDSAVSFSREPGKALSQFGKKAKINFKEWIKNPTAAFKRFEGMTKPAQRRAIIKTALVAVVAGIIASAVGGAVAIVNPFAGAAIVPFVFYAITGTAFNYFTKEKTAYEGLESMTKSAIGTAKDAREVLKHHFKTEVLQKETTTGEDLSAATAGLRLENTKRKFKDRFKQLFT